MHAAKTVHTASVHWIGIIRPLCYIPIGCATLLLALFNPLSDPLLSGGAIRTMLLFASVAAVVIGLAGAVRNRYYSQTQSLGLSAAGELLRLDNGRVASALRLADFDSIVWRRPFTMRVAAFALGVGFEERDRMGVLSIKRHQKGFKHAFTTPVMLDGAEIAQAFEQLKNQARSVTEAG